MKTGRSSEKIRTLEIKDEDFEDQILEISLKKPTRAYNFFLMDMKSKGKRESSDNNITKLSHEFSTAWSKLPEPDKNKYQDMEEEDKQRYANHTALVKKHILEKPLRESATAFTIFVDEYIKSAIQEEEKDPKEARKEAREKWKTLSEEEKVVYEGKKEKHRELYEALKTAKTRVSGYTLFVKDELMQAKEQNTRMTLIDCAEKWKKAKPSIRENYQKYADEVREERERMRDLYELSFGIKPKRPIGAYKFFMMELAKEGKLDGKNPFKEAARLWAQLDDEKKERFQKIAKKRQLAYVIKKSEFLSQQRKTVGKASSAFNLFIADMKDKVEGELPAGGMFEYCFAKWQKASPEVKNKYKLLAEQEKIKSEKKKEERKDKSSDAPKRPNAPYNLFFTERFPVIKEKFPNLVTPEIMKKVADEWNKLDEKRKDAYLQQYQSQLVLYREAVKEWEDSGFHTPLKSNNKSTAKKKAITTIKALQVTEEDEEDIDEEEKDRSRSKSKNKKGKKSEKKIEQKSAKKSAKK